MRQSPREAGNPALVAVLQIGAEEEEDLVEEAEVAAEASELYISGGLLETIWSSIQHAAASPEDATCVAVHSRLLPFVVLYRQKRFTSLTSFKAMSYLVCRHMISDLRRAAEA